MKRKKIIKLIMEDLAHARTHANNPELHEEIRVWWRGVELQARCDLALLDGDDNE